MTAIADLPATQVPFEDVFMNFVRAAKDGLCAVDGVAMSSYRFMEDMATDPVKYSESWKLRLLQAGMGGVGGTVAMSAVLLAGGPLTLLAAMIAVPFFGDNRACTILIANSLGVNMKKSEIYLDCGIQTGQPVFSETNYETGVTQSSNPDIIPGFNASIPGFLMAGVGMYRFEKDLSLVVGFYGTGGAISFTADTPKAPQKIAIAWLVPEKGDPHFAVTGNLSQYGSLQAFYDKTAGARINDSRSFVDGCPRVYGSLMYRRYPNGQDKNDMVLTVFVSE